MLTTPGLRAEENRFIDTSKRRAVSFEYVAAGRRDRTHAIGPPVRGSHCAAAPTHVGYFF